MSNNVFNFCNGGARIRNVSCPFSHITKLHSKDVVLQDATKSTLKHLLF